MSRSSLFLHVRCDVSCDETGEYRGETARAISKALTVFPRTTPEFEQAKGAGKAVEAFQRVSDGFYVPRFWEPPTKDLKDIVIKAGGCGRSHMRDDARVRDAHTKAPSPSVNNRKDIRVTSTYKDKQQKDCILKLVDAWNNKAGGGFVWAYTGAGKTYMFFRSWVKHRKAHLPPHRRGRAMIVVGGAISMWVDRASTFVPDAKVVTIQGKRKKWSHLADADIIVASLHTVVKDDTMPTPEELDVDYVAFDEAHDVGAYFKATMHIGLPSYVMGMSATPHRWDGRGKMLFMTMGPVVAHPIRPTPQHHIVANIVVFDHMPFIPSCTRRVFGKEVFRRDILRKFLYESKQRREAEHRLIQWHLDKKQGTTLVFTFGVDHAQEIYEHYKKVLPEGEAYIITGQTSQQDRILHRTVSLLVVTFAVGRQANDWPHIGSVVFLNGPAVDLMQAIGRGRRGCPEKKFLYTSYLWDRSAVAEGLPTSSSHAPKSDQGIDVHQQRLLDLINGRSDPSRSPQSEHQTRGVKRKADHEEGVRSPTEAEQVGTKRKRSGCKDDADEEPPSKKPDASNVIASRNKAEEACFRAAQAQAIMFRRPRSDNDGLECDEFYVRDDMMNVISTSWPV